MDKELIERLRKMLNEGLPAKLLGTDIQKIITALEAAERTIAAYRKNYNAEEKENEELQQRIAELEGINLSKAALEKRFNKEHEKLLRLDAALVEIEKHYPQNDYHENKRMKEVARKARAGE